MSNKPDDICNAIHKLTVKVGDLVRAEDEKNKLLRGIKNKLSDLVAAKAIYGSHEHTIFAYTDSEERSGFEPFMTHHCYNYYNSNLKQKEDDTDEQHS